MPPGRRLSHLVQGISAKMANAFQRVSYVELREKGFTVLDDALGAESCQEIRNEVLGVKEKGLMFKNASHFVEDQNVSVLEKEQIWEQELEDERIRSVCPAFEQIYHGTGNLLQELSERFDDAKWNFKQGAIKLQVNSGNGGCFPMHTDSDGIVDQRVISAIFYLNKNWNIKHGGELRLYPFPYQVVDIEPVEDRLVLFSSSRMLHRVMPSFAMHRTCFTMWFSGIKNEPDNDLEDTKLNLSEASPHDRLLNSKLRNLIAKIIYAREWADSIEQSHSDSAARNMALQKHWKDVAVISQAYPELVSYAAQMTPFRRDSLDTNPNNIWF